MMKDKLIKVIQELRATGNVVVSINMSVGFNDCILEETRQVGKIKYLTEFMGCLVEVKVRKGVNAYVLFKAKTAGILMSRCVR